MKMRMKTASKQRFGTADSGDADGETQSSGIDVDELQHQNAIDLSAAILRHARDVVTSDGGDFYLIDLPARLSRTEFASTIGILPATVPAHIVISPFAALSKAARPDLKLYYEKGLGHFTPAGIGILVDETARALASSPRLGSCAACAPLLR